MPVSGYNKQLFRGVLAGDTHSPTLLKIWVEMVNLKRQCSNRVFDILAEWNVALRGSRKETREETREETTSSINFEEGIVAAERSVQAAAE